MYEELIRRLRNAAGGPEGIKMAQDAAEAIAALQSENAELREENSCLQHNVAAMQATLDQQAKNCEELLAEKDKRISRVEAERDALLEYANAQMECEMCKNDTFCPMENPMPENCALCELKPKCPCHPCKWEWHGAQGEG